MSKENELNNFYKILEIKSTATDAEIKQAYIKLKNIYNSNNYEKLHLKKIAEEKTKEIELAFEKIMDSRRLERIQNGQSATDETNNNKNAQHSYNQTNDVNSELTRIENLIQANELNSAQNLLEAINENNRPAHWFYLKGLILLKKGWLEEAANFFGAALRMDPTNRIYSDTLRRINYQRKGGFDPFNQRPNQTPYPQTTNCVFCDTCMGMMCANAICSCCDNNAMGGC